MPRPAKDITGNTFHKLTAVKLLRTEPVSWSDGRNRTFAVWLWKCECGKEIESQARYVTRGFKKSCGCHVRHGQDVPAWNSFNQNYADGNLTFNEFKHLTQQNCYYCESPPANKRQYHGHTYIYNGLNRLDHTKPHDTDNVRPCCWTCNERISRWSETEFLAWIAKIYTNRKLSDLC